MKESELHQSSGIALSIINPNNGTHVVMNIPPGQRKGQLILHGPFGKRWIYLSLGVDPEAPGDQDLRVALTTQDPSTEMREDFVKPTSSTVMSLTPTGGFKIEGEGEGPQGDPDVEGKTEIEGEGPQGDPDVGGKTGIEGVGGKEPTGTEAPADYSTANGYVAEAPPVSVVSIDLQIPPVEPAAAPVSASEAPARPQAPKGKKAGG